MSSDHRVGPPDGGVKLNPRDDLRHRPAPGKRMRDSLFWEAIVPEEMLGMQVYLYLTDRGRAGYNVVVWGPETEPLALHLGSGRISDSADLDNLSFEGLRLQQQDPLRTCTLTYQRDDVAIEFDFRGVHDAFTYRQNPDGLPVWFAENRMEQTGHVRGSIQVGRRRIALDRIAHRDHSWGVRDWGVPQHWKWFVAYTPSAVAVNGWIWIARGEWGFGGYVCRDGVATAIRSIDHHADYDDLMRQRHLAATVIDVDGGQTELILDAFGVVELPTHDPLETVIREAACHATIDGEAGAGQFETHWVHSYLEYLTKSASSR
jgi:hypothetical protein